MQFPLNEELRIFTLGTVRIEQRTRPLSKLTKPTKALLVYLALARSRAVARELLAQLFWLSPADRGNDEEEARAQASLRTALKTLRATLGDDLLEEDKEEHTLRLHPARAVWLDAHVADVAARAYLDSPRGSQAPLELFRGEFMAGYEDLPAPAWIEKERARLNELVGQVLIAEARSARQRGEYAAALSLAERVLQKDATNQDACAEAMWCHWRLNQPREGLRVYEELKSALRERSEYPLNALRQLRGKLQNDVERTARRVLQLTNLPLLETSFIGRTRELQELRALLRPRQTHAKRLVTLVGPGGSGKTRLARELAAGVLKQYRDGVWWIELDALEKEKGNTAGESVAQAVAQVLGVRQESERAPAETLVNYLRDKKMLLVLDNCEHVLRACETLCTRILTQCPRIQIVATSREGLRVTGEKQFALAPLDAPKLQGAASLKTLAQFDAVRLFTDRAREENSAFALREDNARDVAQLCRRLDGLPLALELAAARLNTLTLREIVEGLDERFELLKRGKRLPARHETLRAVLDWSFDLLNEDEKELFALLGVFAGRFTEEAAQNVRGDGGRETGVGETSMHSPVFDSLTSLVEKSLVQREFDADGLRRYRLLESLRAYAREKLDADDAVASAAYAQMARYYLEFAKTHQQDFMGLEREWDNLSYGLSIMHWQENWQEVLEYGYALTDAAFARGLYTQARAMYPQVMEAAGRLEEQGADIQMRLNYARAMIEQGFYSEAREVLEQLLRISEIARDTFGIGGAYTLLARVAVERGENERAGELLARALPLWEQRGDAQWLGEVWMRQSQLHYRARRYVESQTLARQALTALQTTEEVLNQIECWEYLAKCAYDTDAFEDALGACDEGLKLCGDRYPRQRAALLYLISQILNFTQRYQPALGHALEALEVFRTIGDVKFEAYVLDHLSAVYMELEQYAQAQLAAQQGLAIFRRLEDPYDEVFVYRNLGRIYERMQKPRTARKFWVKALDQIEREMPQHRLKLYLIEAIGKL